MRLIVTGGGTGGHLFPGLALAQAMLEARPDTVVLFIGTARAVDQQVFAGTDMETVALHCSGLKGTSIGEKVFSLLQQPKAIFAAWRIIRTFRADLVFAVGGYVTGPVMVAARMLGVPICIHEQNSVPGLTNRLAGKIAATICTSIPCGSSFPEHKVVQTGNPVRREIVAIGQKRKKWKAPFTILVLGGSQGAHRINQLVMASARELVEKGHRFRLIHQTGVQDHAQVAGAYAKLGIETVVQPFFQDMAALYSDAHMVVSRAGATTLAELAVAGLPAVLIPYPFAADDHQQTNAEYYARGGGCCIRSEADLTSQELSRLLEKLLVNGEHRLPDMAAAMREMAIPEAADRIVRQCLQLVDKDNSVN